MRFLKATEDQAYPRLSRICIGVGLIALGISAFGSWRFGWSLSEDTVDRTWLAVLYVCGDVAAGVLVAVGALMIGMPGWGKKIGGVIAMIPALALVSLSILSTFGLMSGRIAVFAGQKAAEASDAGRLAWLRGQTMNKTLRPWERRAFLAEERKAAQEAKKTAAVVTDGQVIAIVNLANSVGYKVSPEGAQVALTLASSTIPMTVKFLCLGFGFFLFGLRKSDRKTQDAADKKTQSGSGGGSPGSGGAEPRKPTLVHPEPAKPAALRTMEAASPDPPKVSSGGSRVSTDAPTGKLTFEQFRNLIREDMTHGEPASSTRTLAASAGWSQSSVVREQKKVRGQHNSKVRRFAGNGGGMHPSANG